MRLLSCGVLVCVAGCALFTTRGPDPRRPPDQEPACTSSRQPLYTDGTIYAVGFVSLVVGLLGRKADGDEAVTTALIVGGAATMAATLGSGYVGYSRVKKCEAALEQWELRGRGEGARAAEEPAISR